ncbi:Nuclear factor 7, ovary [Channa argus]|uniref:Nuclear factor 7, ovary n=1 Tax=Channa argus TaxID=215402 RepID=A0A6G1QN17_CHAAH|nr:Nuclear factor 7, ovary [Channa argus]
MASSPEDLCCPTCQDIFKDPVILSCSHSFCRVCLNSWWERKLIQECPVCRARSHWSDPPRNLALKNLCEAFLQEKDQKPALGSEELCHLHCEKLKLFCLDHEQPVCLICRDAKSHTDHRFRPISEAAQDNRGEVREILKPLQDKLKVLNEVNVKFSQTAEHIEVQYQHTERQIMEEFRRLHQFLQEEEEARIAALRKEEEQKSQVMTETLGALSRKTAALSDTIRVTSEQLSTSDVAFLQNYKATVERVKMQSQLVVPQLGSGVLIDMTKHLGNLAYNIWIKMKDIVSYVPVILDPNTANAELLLSDDLTSVRHGKTQHLPENPERFEYWDSVLGSGYTSGTHSWDVEVGDSREWEVGVLAESVCRQGFVGSTVWSVEFSDVGYRAYSPTNKYTALPVRQKIRRIRVHLDWDKGQLSFHEPDTNTHLHSFTQAFTEKLCPYICTRDSLPLKILPVKVSVRVEG